MMLSQACVIFGAVTIFALIMYFVTTPDTWLRPETVTRALAGSDNPEMGKRGAENGTEVVA